MLHHPLINFEIQRYYQDERRFNGVFSRDNLPKKVKDVLVLNIFLKKVKNLLGIKT